MAKQRTLSKQWNKNIFITDNPTYQATAKTLLDNLSIDYRNGLFGSEQNKPVPAWYVDTLISILDIDTEALAQDFSFSMKVCLKTLQKIEQWLKASEDGKYTYHYEWFSDFAYKFFIAFIDKASQFYSERSIKMETEKNKDRDYPMEAFEYKWSPSMEYAKKHPVGSI